MILQKDNSHHKPSTKRRATEHTIIIGSTDPINDWLELHRRNKLRKNPINSYSTTCIINTVIPPTPKKPRAIADSGTKSHYIATDYRDACTIIQPNSSVPDIRSTNGSYMSASQSAKVPLSTNISTIAKQDQVLDDLCSGFLISIGKLAGDNCINIFSKYNVHVIKMDTSSLHSPKTPPTAYGTYPSPQEALISTTLHSVPYKI